QAVLVHRALPRRRRRRAREMQQLDAHAVTGEVERAQLRAAQPQQGIGRLALDRQLVLDREAEQITVEAQRALEIGDADPDVGQALDRELRHRASSAVMLTLIDPVALSAAVRKAAAMSASGKRCVTRVSPIRLPSRASRSCTISKSAREPARL